MALEVFGVNLRSILGVATRGRGAFDFPKLPPLVTPGRGVLLRDLPQSGRVLGLAERGREL